MQSYYKSSEKMRASFAEDIFNSKNTYGDRESP